MQKFFFPLNYNYSNKFLGILDYNTLLPLSIYSAIIIFLLNLFSLDFFISFGIFLFIVVPPLLLFSIGINHQPATSYFLAVFRFYKKSNLYLYKNDCQNSQKRLWLTSRRSIKWNSNKIYQCFLQIWIYLKSLFLSIFVLLVVIM